MSNVDIVRKAQGEFLQSGRPELRTGMEVEVYQKIKEGNKERVQRFKGIIISTAGKSELEKTITVRRKVGAFGVEKIFAIHSPGIEKIEVLRQFKVRRKSIKYIRDLTGKAARLKEIPMSKDELNTPKELPVVVHAEEVVIVDEAGQAQVETEVVAQSGDHEEAVVTAQEVDAKEALGETIEEIVEEAEEKVEAVKHEAATSEKQQDDLTKVEGVGPKVAEALQNAGIGTYAQLAKASQEDIQKAISDVAGGHNSDSWPKQAGLAADGKWDELNAWQEEYKNGIEK